MFNAPLIRSGYEPWGRGFDAPTTKSAFGSNPRTRALLHDAMREVVAVGRAQGVQLAEDFADNRLAFSDGLPATMTSSMHNDLERGNRLEVDGLSGDVVERGRATGVPTPVNRAIYDILLLHAVGQGQV